MGKHLDTLEGLMGAQGADAINAELLRTLRDMDGKLDGLNGKVQAVEKEVAVISAHVEDNKALQQRVHDLELQLAKLDPDNVQKKLDEAINMNWKLQVKMAGFSAIAASVVVAVVELVKLLTN